MKKLLALLLALCMTLPLLISCGTGEQAGSDKTDMTETEAAVPNGLVLVSEGKTDYVIVTGENASPADANAALELQNYLKQISGVEVPIVKDTTAESAKEIIVGKTNREAEGEFPRETFNEDGFIIKTVADKLYIVGTEERGSLYGVYEFLESYLGCRFYTQEIEKIPTLTTISLSPIEEDKQIPTLSWRVLGWKDMDDIDFSVKRKIFGLGTEYDRPDWGCSKSWDGGHNMTADWGLIPVKEYENEHPEYFALVNGVRENSATYEGSEFTPQLCLSNPEVVTLLTEKALQHLRTNYKGQGVYLIGQSDGAAMPCECDECMKIYEEEGGALSGTLIRAVNAVARAAKKEFPDVKIMTLAYNYSRSAPITPPEDNVVIWMTVQKCQSHPVYADCQANIGAMASYTDGTSKSFAENLEDWGKLTDRIYIYEYYMHYQDYPCTLPDFYHLYDEMRFYYENGMGGMYAQGCAEGRSTEFGELRAYLVSKLLWDPTITEEEYWAMLDEYMLYVYGPGYTYLKDYLALADSLTEERCIFNDYVQNQFPMPVVEVNKTNTLPDGITFEEFVNYKETDWSKYWNWYKDIEEPRIITEGEMLFDKAMELAENDAQRTQIDKSSIQVDYIRAYYLYFKYHYDMMHVEKMFNRFCKKYPELVTVEGDAFFALRTELYTYPAEQVRMIYENYCKELIEHMLQYTTASNDWCFLEDYENFNYANRPQYWHLPYLAEW